VKYKENTDEELRNKVKEMFQLKNTALLPLDECIEEVMKLMKAEYNRGYAEGYLIAYEEHA
jgi:hypothetical protein